MLDEYRCLLCWTTFDGPGDLAAHEQDEEDRLYVVDGLTDG